MDRGSCGEVLRGGLLREALVAVVLFSNGRGVVEANEFLLMEM